VWKIWEAVESGRPMDTILPVSVEALANSSATSLASASVEGFPVLNLAMIFCAARFEQASIYIRRTSRACWIYLVTRPGRHDD